MSQAPSAVAGEPDAAMWEGTDPALSYHRFAFRAGSGGTLTNGEYVSTEAPSSIPELQQLAKLALCQICIFDDLLKQPSRQFTRMYRYNN
jgi:hypothetical protein